MDIVLDKPKRGRKLKVEGQSKAERKRRANNNEPYIDSKGKIREPKIFQPIESCCSKSCFEFIDHEEQREVFDKFYHLGSFSSRATFFSANIRMQMSKFPSKKFDQKQHSMFRVYSLKDKPVCADFFSSLLQVNPRRVYLALKKFQEYNLNDLRGKFPHPKMSAYKTEFAVEVIMSIPRYISHYCRETSSACYLGCEWDKAKIFRLYEHLWKEDNPNEKSISRKSFDNIFNRFNLKFKGRVKDGCKTCDILKVQESAGKDVKDLREAHHEDASYIRGMMKNDLERSKVDDTLEVITFDFQKVLQFPKLETSIIYYLRQPSLLNFGVHSGKYNKFLLKSSWP
jgi:hypothetical protein